MLKFVTRLKVRFDPLVLPVAPTRDLVARIGSLANDPKNADCAIDVGMKRDGTAPEIAITFLDGHESVHTGDGIQGRKVMEDIADNTQRIEALHLSQGRMDDD